MGALCRKVNSEIKFLRIGETKKDIEKINEILLSLKKKLVDKDVLVGKRFLNAIVRASEKEEIEFPKMEIPKPARIIPKKIVPKPKPVKITPKVPAPPILFSKRYPLVIYRKGSVLVDSRADRKDNKLIYTINEPEINKELLTLVKRFISKRFNRDKTVVTNDKFLTEKIKKASKKLKQPYSEKTLDLIKYYLQRDLIGFGRIDALFFDANINSIICDGLNIPVKIILLSTEMKTNIAFDNKKELDDLIKNFAARLKQDITKKNIVEGKISLMVREKIVNFRVDATLGIAEISSKFVLKRL